MPYELYTCAKPNLTTKGHPLAYVHKHTRTFLLRRSTSTNILEHFYDVRPQAYFDVPLHRPSCKIMFHGENWISSGCIFILLLLLLLPLEYFSLLCQRWRVGMGMGVGLRWRLKWNPWLKLRPSSNYPLRLQQTVANKSNVFLPLCFFASSLYLSVPLTWLFTSYFNVLAISTILWWCSVVRESLDDDSQYSTIFVFPTTKCHDRSRLDSNHMSVLSMYQYTIII